MIYMLLGVDIGGTKTLLGLFDSTGKIVDSIRFETPKKYSEFLKSFESAYKQLSTKVPTIVIAAPGRIDRKKDVVVAFGNLNWTDTPLRKDLEKLTGKHIKIENDAKLAALAEAKLLKDKYDKVLYITISTGIGSGLVYKGHLDEAMIDSEAGQMLLPNPDDKSGALHRWEEFASGKALFAKYGKKASELDDAKSWADFSKKIALGVAELCAVIEPDAVIIGGGVGSHFHKFDKYLASAVLEMLPKIVKKPVILGAKNAELASLMGCFVYANQK